VKIILFGTGKGAEIVYNSLNLEKTEIVCFLDNNQARQGSTFMGYRIDAPERIWDHSFDYVIIASQYTQEIKAQLLSLGVEEEKIISYFQIYNDHADEVFRRSLELNLFDFKNIVRMYYPDVTMIEETEMTVDPRRPTFLFFNHSYGGGTKVYQDSLIRKLQDSTNIVLAHILLGHLVLIHLDDRTRTQRCFFINIPELTQERFNGVLKRLGVRLIYINQLVSFPVHEFIRLIKGSNVDYLFFIHDYFCVCPSFNLINSRGEYCGGEKDAAVCRQCIHSGLVTEEAVRIDRRTIDIRRWRGDFHDFLRHAHKIVAPSESAKDLVAGYYPDVRIEVREHEIDSSLFEKTYDPDYAYDHALKIAFVGNISKAKGSGLIDELTELIRESGVPIRVKVIGSTETHKTCYRSDDQLLEVTGPYERGELSRLLQQHRVSLVVIPALWPETFNYTTSEVMQAGYPVMTFDIGAPAERVRRTGAGWIVERRDAAGIFQALRELERDRDRIAQAAFRLGQQLS